MELYISDKKYINSEICRECGGKCCKGMAGSNIPADFGINKYNAERIIKGIFDSGFYSVDCWESGEKEEGQTGDSQYFIRPKHKLEMRLFDRSWGGECIFLNDNGCKLEYDKRPAQCRYLEPKKPKCLMHKFNKEYCKKLWLPYGHIIDKYLDERGD